MTLVLALSTTYNLLDVATDVFQASPNNYVVLRGRTFEGSRQYHDFQVLEDLEDLESVFDEVRDGDIYNVKYPEDGAPKKSMSFSLGNPDPEILREYEQIDQDGGFVIVFGRSDKLRMLLQDCYASEQLWRDKSHVVNIKHWCIANNRHQRREREACEAEDDMLEKGSEDAKRIFEANRAQRAAEWVKQGTAARDADKQAAAHRSVIALARDADKRTAASRQALKRKRAASTSSSSDSSSDESEE